MPGGQEGRWKTLPAVLGPRFFFACQYLPIVLKGKDVQVTAGSRSNSFSQSGSSHWWWGAGGVDLCGFSLLLNESGNFWGKGGESVRQVPQCALLKLGFFHTIGGLCVSLEDSVLHLFPPPIEDVALLRLVWLRFHQLPLKKTLPTSLLSTLLSSSRGGGGAGSGLRHTAVEFAS